MTRQQRKLEAIKRAHASWGAVAIVTPKTKAPLTYWTDCMRLVYKRLDKLWVHADY